MKNANIRHSMTRSSLNKIVASCLLTYLAQPVFCQTFTDVSNLLHPLPLAGSNSFQRGASAVDFNNDGLVDIYQPNFRDQGRLYLNLGNDGFLDVLEAAGIDEGVNLWGAAFGDYNADGYLDILFEDLSGLSKFYKNNKNVTFTQVNDPANLHVSTLAQGAAWADFNLDGTLDLMVVNDHGPNQLFKNLDGQRFLDISLSANVQTMGNSYGISWGDINGDGYPDAYIASCQASQPLLSINHLLLNNQNETFTDIGPAAGVADSLAGWAPLMLDYDNDNDLDIFVSNSVHLPRPGQNRLYRNDGNLTFTNVAGAAGVATEVVASNYGSAAADFDNDGWIDIFVTNLGHRDRLFHNNGDGTFTDIALAAGLPLNQHRSGALADFNNDGWIDIVTTGNPQDVLLFNDGGDNHWLRIRARGLQENYHGVGTRIEVYAGGSRQIRDIQAGDGFCQQNLDLSAHFGLGANTVVDSIVFRWPGGDVDRLFEIGELDRELTMIQSFGVDARPTSFNLLSPVDGDTLETGDSPELLFDWSPALDDEQEALTYTLHFSGTDLWTGAVTDTSFAVLDQTSLNLSAAIFPPNHTYIWSADVFDGHSVTATMRPVTFTVDPFGPLFSRPAESVLTAEAAQSSSVSWADVDGNGFPDLFVANAGDERNFLFLNTNGIFTEVVDGDLVNSKQNSFGASWSDFNNDGFLDLFVSNAGDENNALFANQGDGTFTGVTDDIVANDGGNSIDCCWADYDGDGYTDLYVTNVSNAANFLYHNLAGRSFEKVTEGAIATEARTSFGCAWADYDGDGDADLFVANSAENSLFTNAGEGVFVQETTGPVVTDKDNSRGGSWGDFDNDGDFDLYVTNLGINTFYENTGDGDFERVSESALTSDNLDSRSSSWGDYDNDGFMDLFIANAGSDMLFLNNGHKNFIALAPEHLGINDGTSNSVASADLDRDGDLDLYISNLDRSSANVVQLNSGPSRNWLQVKCVGTVSNRAALGAKVWVKAATVNGGGAVWQVREISARSGFASQSQLVAPFGLGNANAVDSLRIDWPSGLRSYLVQLDPNQLITVVEDSTVTSVDRTPTELPEKFTLQQNFPNPFNPTTTIRYELPATIVGPAQVTLRIYNITGQMVRTLVQQEQSAGSHAVQWDGRNDKGVILSSGLYVYELSAGEKRLQRKMLFLK